jgi:hypothetical protein
LVEPGNIRNPRQVEQHQCRQPPPRGEVSECAPRREAQKDTQIRFLLSGHAAVRAVFPDVRLVSRGILSSLGLRWQP